MKKIKGYNIPALTTCCDCTCVQRDFSDAVIKIRENRNYSLACVCVIYDSGMLYEIYLKIFKNFPHARLHTFKDPGK